MSKKEVKGKEVKASVPSSTPTVSKLRKGSGTQRDTNRIITIYGTFKTRKTGSLMDLIKRGRCKVIASDSNAIPTLRALDAMPHADDIYEPRSVAELHEILEEAVTICENDGKDALGIDVLVIDSYTQFSDWHQASIAKETGQKFLGDNKMDNGWQRFNAEFGACLDLIVALSRYITVVGIVHAKDKFDLKKGQYASFSLSPAMAERLGRMSNWILLKSFEEVVDDAKLEEAKTNPDDPYYVIEDDKVYEDIFYTKPVSGFVASANTLKFRQQEPGRSLLALMEKDGLL